MDSRLKSEVENDTQKVWLALWEQILPNGAGQELLTEEWQKLCTRYSEPHRAYHTLEHIDYVLEMLKKFARKAGDKTALAYAALRHDEIYFAHWRPQGLPGNEALSAAIADEALAKAAALGSPVCTPEFRKKVFRLIMVTLHDPEAFPPETADEMLVADIDWSAIGLPRQLFIEQRRRIRIEFSAYNDEEFRLGSIDFFTKAGKRKRQFYLPEFRDKFELQARRNIENTLEVLESGSVA